MGRNSLDYLEMIAEAGEFTNTLLRFGISDGYSQLRFSEALPETIVSNSDSEIRLLLHHGSKFLTNKVFVSELMRKRTVRVFLLLHEHLRDDDRQLLISLHGKMKGRLEVRTYADVPDFRLVFVDQSYLMLSHYTSEEEEREAGTQASWEAPQLRIDARLRTTEAGVNYSLYGTFRKVWFDRWRLGRPLDLEPDTSGLSPRRNIE